MLKFNPKWFIVISCGFSSILVGVVIFAFQGGQAATRQHAVDQATSLEYSTYLGGAGDDFITDIAIGPDYSIYLTGGTFTDGFGQVGDLKESPDVFIAKLSPDGKTLEYLQIFGGGGWDDGQAIDVDANGNVYITGQTEGGSFPVTNNAFDTSFNGGPVSMDAFVVKLDPDGSIVYSSFLGGSGYLSPENQPSGGGDAGYGIAAVGEFVYVTGWTSSSDFPTTANAFDVEYGNALVDMTPDAFIVKMSLDAHGESDLVYGTYLGGGGGLESGRGLQADLDGNIYVVGSVTNDYAAEFPRTAGAVDMILAPDDADGFLVKLYPAGLGEEDLIYATLWGGQRVDEIHDIELDVNNTVYLVGVTASAELRTTQDAFDEECGTDAECDYEDGWGVHPDAFITWLNPDPNQAASQNLLYSSFLGGADFDGNDFTSVQVVQPGEVVIAGMTLSTDTFPTTENAYANQLVGSSPDAFAVRLQLNGNGQDDLIYGSYFGGSEYDHLDGIAVDNNLAIWIAGRTESTDLPTTPDALFATHQGGTPIGTDGFLARLATVTGPDLSGSAKYASSLDVVDGDIVTFTVALENSGNLTATVRFTDTLPASLLLTGVPTASLGIPVVNEAQITWGGEVVPAWTVWITYTAEVDAGSEVIPPIVNEAQIHDGIGNIYIRSIFLNASELFIPWINK